MLYEKTKKIFPGGVNSPVRFFQPHPIFMNRGNGSKIYDIDGNRYLDYCLAYGPLILGHENIQVRNAIVKTLKKGWILGTPTLYELEFAKILKEAIPVLEMLRYTNSGTEATMHAIRLSRAYTGKKIIIKIAGSYHGAHDSVLVNRGHGNKGIPSSPGVLDEIAGNTLVINFNDFTNLEKVINENKNNISAMIIEPVLGNIGVIPPVEGYLKFIREITEKNDILLIFDEVITGFRERLGSAQDYYHVEADLITLGKIIGGGLPIGLFGGKEEIMKKVAPQGKVYQAGTFSGNPLSMSAGIATLKKLKLKDYNSINKKTEKLINNLQKISHDYDLNITINHFGSMFQLFFSDTPVKDYNSAKKSDDRQYFDMFQYFLKNGIYLAPNQFETNFLSFVHTEKDIKKTTEIFEKFADIMKRKKRKD